MILFLKIFVVVFLFILYVAREVFLRQDKFVKEAREKGIKSLTEKGRLDKVKKLEEYPHKKLKRLVMFGALGGVILYSLIGAGIAYPIAYLFFIM